METRLRLAAVSAMVMTLFVASLSSYIAPEAFAQTSGSNTPPVLDPIELQAVREGTLITFTATATDEDIPPDTLTFSLVDGAAGSVPPGTSIDPTTGVFEWATNFSDGGFYTFDVMVSDGAGGSDSETVEVIVADRPDSQRPSLDGRPILADDPDNLDDVYGVGDTFRTSFRGPTDATAGDTMTDAQFNANFVTSEDLGEVSGEWLTDRDLLLTVDVANGAPVIGTTTISARSDSLFIGTTAAMTGDFGIVPVILSITAFGSDNGDTVYSAGDRFLIFFNQATNMRISDTMTDAQFNANFVTSEDLGEVSGEWLTERDLLLTVDVANGAPVIGTTTVSAAPGITIGIRDTPETLFTGTSSPLTGNFGRPVPSLTGQAFVADDPDDGDRAYGIGDTFAITFAHPTDAAAGDTITDAQFNANFTTSEDLGEVTGIWSDPSTLLLTVDVANGAPVIGTTTVSAAPGATIGSMFNSDVPISGTSNPLSGDFGNDNTPPVLDPIELQAVREGTLITFTATATDEDIPPDTLTFSLVDGAAGSVPSGTSIDPTTGVFEWATNFSDGGFYTFDVMVSDGAGGSDSETVEVIVADRPDSQRPSLDGRPILADDPDNLDDVYGVGDTFRTSFRGPTDATAGDTMTDAQFNANFVTSEDLGEVSGEWLTDRDLLLTVDVANGAPVIGTTTVSARSDSLFIGTTAAMTGDFGIVPVILSITAFGSDNGDTVYSAGDRFLIFFNHPTTMNTFDTMTDAQFNANFVTSEDLGVVSGEWLTERDLLLTVDVANGAPVIGTTTVSAAPGITIGIRDAPETLFTGTSSPLTGNFGRPVSSLTGQAFVADDPDDGDRAYGIGDTFAITFAHPTDAAAGDTMTDAQFNANFVTSEDLGEVTGIWSDPSTFLLTVDVANGAPVVGTTTISAAPGATIGSMFNSDVPISGTSNPLSGDFGNDNAAPVLSPIGPQTGVVGTPLTFTATATDEDIPPDTLTFSLDDGATGSVPTGAAIDPTTGAFAWTPQESQIAEHTFDVIVTDGVGGSDSETVTVTVSGLNSPPVLDTIGPQTGVVGTPLTFTATATDEDIPPDTLTFSLDDGATGSVPTGAAIDPTTGAFAWTPQESQIAEHTFDVMVSDGVGDSDSETVTVTVSGLNSPPVLDTIGPQRGDEGTLITFTATATDPDVPADTLEFTMNNSTGSVPSTATLDPQSGVFEWTPTERDGGTIHTFPVMVSDGIDSDSQLVTVTVDDTNSAPVLTVPTIEDSYPEQAELQLFFLVTDSDRPNDNSYTFELTGTGSELVDSFGASDGLLVWTPAEDEDGTYRFTVTVTDSYAGNPLSDSHTFDLVIDEQNSPPALDTIGPQRGDAGSTITFTATATDEDVPSNPLTFSLDDGATGSVPTGAAIDPTTGAFAWTPQESQIAEHTFDVTVTDGAGGSDSETVTVTVTAVTGASGDNTAPVLVAPTIEPSYPEGVQFELDFDVTDADSDQSHTFALTGTSSSLVDSFDASTGTLVWTPGETQDGAYGFTVTVTDDHAEDPQSNSHTFDLVIREQNSPPTAVAASPLQGNELVRISSSAVLFSDPDVINGVSDVLSVSLTGNVPTGLTIGSNGVITWTPTEQQDGEHAITVQVTDGESPPVTVPVTVTVNEVNDPPTGTTIPAQNAAQGVPFTLDLAQYFSDDDIIGGNPDLITYSLDSPPDWLSIDGAPGLLGGTVTRDIIDNAPSNPLTITVVTADLSGAQTRQSFSLTLVASNAQPVLNPIGPVSGVVNALITFTATATDADIPSNPLTFSLVDGASGSVPSGAAIDQISGVFAWAPQESQAGAHTFDVTVTDGAGGSDSETVTVTVDDISTDNPTTYTPIAPLTLNEGDPRLEINLGDNFVDADTANLLYSVAITKDSASFDDAVIGINNNETFYVNPNFESHGVYQVTVIAQDGTNTPATGTFTVTINDVNRAVSPFTGNAIETAEGETASFNIVHLGIQDPDGPITCEKTSGPGDLTISSACVLDYVIGETLGGSSYDFVVRVTGTNDAGAPEALVDIVDITIPFMTSEVNLSPVGIDIPSQTATLGTPFNLDASQHFSDADIIGSDTPDTLYYSLGGTTPDWLSIDGTTGMLGGILTPEILASAPSNPVTIQVIATDTTGLTASESFDLTLIGANSPPVLVAPTIASSYLQGLQFELDFDVTDADSGQSHTFALTGTSSSLVDSFDAATGILAWTPGETQDGAYRFTVSVTDDHAEDPQSDSHTFDLVIREQNLAPVLNPIGSQSGNVGTPTIFIATATDADTPPDTLRFSLADGAAGSVPDGAAIDPVSGVFEWTPNASQIAVHTFDVTVSDGTDSVSETITVVVVSTGSNNVPLLVAPAIASFYPQGVQFELDFDVTDADSGQSHTFALTGTNSSLVDSFDAATGILTWTPDETQDGAYRFTVSVTDDHAEDPQSNSRTFDLVILERNVVVGASNSASAKEKSGESREYLKAPTFGKSRLNNNQVVECGYSMDGQCIDVLDYHEEYKRQVIQTNSTHDFTLKAFGQSPIKQFQIGFGVSGVGEPINNAEAIIKIITTQDNKSVYSVDSVEIVDNDNTIDFDPQNASVQKVSCTDDDKNGDKTPQCVELALNGVLFREQFHSEPFVIHVMDNNRRSSHNYMNEGLLIQGQSLNPAHTASKLGMPFGTSDLVNFELTRTDKLADIWTDQFGHTWTQNSFGTWLQLTFPEIQHNDGDAKPVTVMTRVHSDFADLVMEEQDKATLIFDAANIVNQTPETFSYDYSGSDHDLTRTQNLAEQIKVEQERAQKILDSIK